MMPKWRPQSMKIHTFLKKAEMHETICFTIENVVLGTKKSSKFNLKSMQNRCKKKACKKYGKLCQKGAKKGTKIC